MDYRIVLSASARADLRNIVRYISLDDPKRALEFGRFLVYRVDPSNRVIEIIRFWHGARGTPDLGE